jgi:hypothetical protein
MKPNQDAIDLNVARQMADSLKVGDAIWGYTSYEVRGYLRDFLELKGLVLVDDYDSWGNAKTYVRFSEEASKVCQ